MASSSHFAKNKPKLNIMILEIILARSYTLTETNIHMDVHPIIK